MTAADVAKHVVKLLQDRADVGYHVVSEKEVIVTTDKLTITVLEES